MENHVGTMSGQFFGGARHGEMARHGVDRNAAGGLCRRDHVLQGHAGDVAFAETTIAQQALGQLAADHAGGAQSRNLQNPLLFIVVLPLTSRASRTRRVFEGWPQMVLAAILQNARGERS